MDAMLQRLGLEKGEAIIHPWINKALEKAQQKVEAHNFEARKNLLKFDDVMNDQRKVVYEQRKDLMRSRDVADTVVDMRHTVVENLVNQFVPEKAYQEQWDIAKLEEEIGRIFAFLAPVRAWSNEEGVGHEEVRARLIDLTDRFMAEKATNTGPDIWRMVEKNLLLQTLDQHWKEHLFHLDHLRQGISLRAYGQRDPLNEYKREAFDMFDAMLKQLREHVTSLLARVQITIGPPPEQQAFEMRQQQLAAAATGGPNVIGPDLGEAPPPPEVTNDPSTWGRVSRNAPCPCGSGKKYKHCHGADA